MSPTPTDPWLLQVGVIGFGYAFLLATSGHLVDWVLSWADDEKRAQSDGGGERGTTDATPSAGGRPSDDAAAGSGAVTQQDRDVGTIVGKAENVLLLTFILAEAYTALAVIFAAKGLVRREDIEKNTLYYLAGTMTNVTYSVAVGVAIRVALVALGAGDISFLNTP